MRIRLDYQEQQGAVLEAYADGGRWNGFVVPLATLRQVEAFFKARASEDPNGDWSAIKILVSHPESLALLDLDGDVTESWNGTHTKTPEGEYLYLLDGWQWVVATDAGREEG